MDEQLDYIQSKLTRKLEEFKLQDRITFDDSALKALFEMSQGEESTVDLYAGTAVLNALQDQKRVITGEDILAVDDSEAINLAFGRINIWDQIRYIGALDQDVFPDGVQLRRAKTLWDANREEDTDDSVKYGRLPQYALTDRIEYVDKGLLGRPEVKIPFRFRITQSEVEAVAQSVASFASEYTGEPQEIKIIPNQMGIEFFVQSVTPPGEYHYLNRQNYRVSKDLMYGMKVGSQAAVIIATEILNNDGKATLEAYIQSVKPNGK